MIVAVVRIAHVVNLGFVTVFGDGQFIVPVAGRADGKAVAAAVGGADFRTVPANGSSGNFTVEADGSAVVAHSGDRSSSSYL